ncbi:MAG: hypothetical protein ACXU7D_04740 [Burkholderiaceae bacterium]
MRKINEFSPIEWLKLLPLQQSIKQVRNDLLLSLYKRARPEKLDAFLAANQHLADKNIAIVIAFEQPWALNWLLRMGRKNLSDTTILVFDNSRTESTRLDIEHVCNENGASYLALPPYRTKHVNRSHGMAMTWVFHNVVRAIKPRVFGFIDHDLIPVDKVDFSERIGAQPVFGLINAGTRDYWSIWAGYCMFKYDAIKSKSLNFLYDFSRDLDTGGRNWNPIYSQLQRNQLRFASKEHLDITAPSIDSSRLVECVDSRWIHIGGISYNDNLKDKFAFFRALERTLEEGSTLDQLQTNK